MNKIEILENIKNTTVDLIKFPTFFGNNQAFLDLFEYVKKKMKNFNIEEKIIRYDNKDNFNLVISNTVDKCVDLIFCCHVDVVPATEYKAYEKDNKLYGRGSIDMKGQTAVILELLKNVKTTKKVALILTSDEEVGGFSCRELIKDYNCKLAVIPDGGSNFDLIVEEKGLVQLELKSSGISAHGSEPFNGDNAIVKLINLYNDLIKQYPIPTKDEYILSITLSKLHGGDANNKVPDNATMNLDIRFTKNDNINKLLDYIQNYSKDISINILDHEPVFYVNKNLDVIQNFIEDCNRILKRNITITKCCAGSDAPYFSEKNIPVIMMNPIGANWHKKDEYVEIESLYTLYEIFKTLL